MASPPSVRSNAVVSPGLPFGVWLAVLAGFVVRALFLADKPFWRDEAWVALIAAEPFAAAASGRASPVGFLWLTQLVAANVPLASEFTYRLIPLAAGVAAIAALARWALSLGASRVVATVVAWLAAGVPPLVYYSRELKSYELDFLLAIVAPMAAAAAFATSAASRNIAPAPAGDPAASGAAAAGRSRTAARATFVAVAGATPWLSFGGIFAVGAVFAWGWVAWWRGLDPAARRWWIGATVLFLASFAAVYAIALGAQSGDRWMHQYWSFHLRADRRLWFPAKVVRAMWQYADVATRYFFPDSWPAATALAAVGAWSWPRATRAQQAFLFVATAGACATAAALDRYLLANGRLLLFAAPVALLWIAQGLVVLAGRIGRRGLAVAAAVAMSLWWSGESIRWRVGEVRTRQANFFRYDVLQDVDLAIRAAGRLVPPGEPLLVSRKASYAFQFYYDGEPIRAAFCVRDCRGAEALAKRWLRAAPRRAWILLTDEEVRSMRAVVREAGFLVREPFAARGVRLWQVRRRGGVQAGRPLPEPEPRASVRAATPRAPGTSARPRRPARPARP